MRSHSQFLTEIAEFILMEIASGLCPSQWQLRSCSQWQLKYSSFKGYNYKLL